MAPLLGSNYHQMEQPLLKEGGDVECIPLDVGCISEDCDSVRSTDTYEYVAVPVAGSTSRRKRKMLQPRRAPMYGSEVAGGDSGPDSKEHWPGPQQERQQPPATDNSHNNRADRLAPSAPKPVPGANKTCKNASIKGAKNSKKKNPTNPICGPCDHCGATASPQWRHGTKEKPVVCNACGIRYGRTNSFDKAPAADKKRTAGDAAISGGSNRCIKRAKTQRQPTASVDAWQEEAHESINKPTRRILKAIKNQSRSPTAGGLTEAQATSPYDSPTSTGTIFDVASTPPSPLRLDDNPAAAAAGGVQNSGACSSNPSTTAQQQQVLHRGRAGQTSSRLGPSPLGRVSATGAPVAGAVAITNIWADHFAPIAGAEYMQPRVNLASNVVSAAAASGNSAANTPHSSPPLAVPEVHPAARIAGVAAPCAPVFQPEQLQWVSKLVSDLGCVEAAAAFLRNSCIMTPSH